jgi:hypothetical protein
MVPRQTPVSFTYLQLQKNTDISCRPENKEELFNLRHSSLRNVVERIFGVIKRRFCILLIPPEYTMKVQARIPPALCALHNFIRRYDPDEIETYITDSDDSSDAVPFGKLAQRMPTRRSHANASAKRDTIAQQMWTDYLSWREAMERRGAV